MQMKLGLPPAVGRSPIVPPELKDYFDDFDAQSGISTILVGGRVRVEPKHFAIHNFMVPDDCDIVIQGLRASAYTNPSLKVKFHSRPCQWALLPIERRIPPGSINQVIEIDGVIYAMLNVFNGDVSDNFIATSSDIEENFKVFNKPDDTPYRPLTYIAKADNGYSGFIFQTQDYSISFFHLVFSQLEESVVTLPGLGNNRIKLITWCNEAFFFSKQTPNAGEENLFWMARAGGVVMGNGAQALRFNNSDMPIDVIVSAGNRVFFVLSERQVGGYVDEDDYVRTRYYQMLSTTDIEGLAKAVDNGTLDDFAWDVAGASSFPGEQFYFKSSLGNRTLYSAVATDGQGGFAAINASNGRMIYSPNGLDWYYANGSMLMLMTDIQSIVYNEKGKYFIALGNADSFFLSFDGGRYWQDGIMWNNLLEIEPQNKIEYGFLLGDNLLLFNNSVTMDTLHWLISVPDWAYCEHFPLEQDVSIQLIDKQTQRLLISDKMGEIGLPLELMSAGLQRKGWHIRETIQIDHWQKRRSIIQVKFMNGNDFPIIAKFVLDCLALYKGGAK